MPFSPEMALALRECRKSETRRVVKHPLLTKENEFDEFDGSGTIEDGSFVWHTVPKSGSRICVKPKYNVGDVCFVQEAWRIIMRPRRARIADEHGGHDGCSTLVQYKYGDLPSSADSPVRIVGSDRAWRECPQSADMGFADASPTEGKLGKWRSPRFMPAWAARTFVEITSVRVERVRDISIHAALLEGLRCPDCGYTSIDAGFHMDHGICVNSWLKRAKAGSEEDHSLIASFRELWNRLHPKAPYRFEDDPFCWVYGISVTEKP